MGCYDRRDAATLDAGQIARGVVAIAGLVSVFVGRAFITLLRRAGTGENRSVRLATHKDSQKKNENGDQPSHCCHPHRKSKNPITVLDNDI